MLNKSDDTDDDDIELVDGGSPSSKAVKPRGKVKSRAINWGKGEVSRWDGGERHLCVDREMTVACLDTACFFL